MNIRMDARVDRGWRAALLTLTIVLVGTCLLHGTPSWARARVLRVGVVADGPLTKPNERMLERLMKEAALLLAGAGGVTFAADKRLVAQWSVESVRSANDALLADGEVDAIVAVGVLTTADFAARPQLAKPVLAPLAVDPALSGLPLREGRSGKHNFSYQVYLGRARRDIEAFRELTQAKVIHVVVDDLLMQVLSGMERFVREMSAKLGVVPVHVAGGSKAADALAALPTDAEAVYLTPLPRMNDGEREKLYAGLKARKLPSFSMTGRSELEMGALATQTRGVDYLRLARRAAINLERVARGEDPATFEVLVERRVRLIINMAVARAIELSPTWSVLASAELVHDEHGSGSRRLTLADAMREAVRRNWDVVAARQRVLASEQRVRAARAGVLPRVDAQFGHQTVRKEVADASANQQPWHEGTVSGTLSQFLFVEPVLADIAIQKHNRGATEAALRTTKLDVVAQAATAYLDLLRAQASAEIERSNALLTAENLESAQIRRGVGTTGPSDVYRWQAQLAADRRRAIDARAQVDSARYRLSQLLRYPQQQPLAAVEPAEDDPTLLPRHEELRGYFSTPKRLARFEAFLVEEGCRAAPELAQLDATVSAQQRLYTSRGRALYLPQLLLTGQMGYDVYRKFGADTLGDITLPDGSALSFGSAPRFSWVIGATMALPIFTGFEQLAEKRRALRELGEVQAQRDSVRLAVERRIRTAVATTRAASAAIHFTRVAAEASRKNLEVVTDGYGRGVTTTIQLLDAQTSALTATQAAATAIFDYLRTIVELQRATGRFELFVSAEEREAWFARLAKHFARHEGSQALHEN